MQQVNLYLPEFRPNREPLCSMHMVWAVLGLIVLLAFYSLYSSHRNGVLRDQIASEQLAMQEAQTRLQQLAQLQPKNQREQLDAEIVRLQAERDRRKQIFVIISRQDLGNTSGFSAQLQTMARQSLDAIALERFSLQKGGTYVEFSGTTHRADLLPVYLQRLRTEASFAQVDFGVLRVERPENSASPLLFQLAKAEKDDKTQGAGDYFTADKPGDKR